MNACVAAVDCGTSVVKAAVFALDGRLVADCALPLPVRRGPDGAVEQDPRRLVDAALAALRGASARARAVPAAVAVTNQRATVIPLDADGAPLGPAIGWQDMRGAPDVADLQARFGEAAYYGITGLPCHAVFTLGKLLFLRRHDPARFRRAARFALVQDWVLRALGCERWVTDEANAALTGLFDGHRRRWSDRILAAAGIAVGQLPALVPPGTPVGHVSRAAAGRCGLPAGTPIVAGAGDQQCAGLGAGVARPGLCSITLGTAGVCFCHAARPVRDPRRRLACVAHAVPGAWAVEGLQNAAGDSVRWAAERLAGGWPLNAAMRRAVAAVPPGAEGVVFFPFLAGAAAPHWISEATGAFLGVNTGHGAPAMLRAVLEGVVFENRLILEEFAALRLPVRDLRLTGGFSHWAFWNQMQADIYGRPVRTLACPEATLLGAAMLAAVGCGALPSLAAAARRMVRPGRVWRPRPAAAHADEAAFRRYVRVLDGVKQQRLFAALAGAGTGAS